MGVSENEEFNYNMAILREKDDQPNGATSANPYREFRGFFQSWSCFIRKQCN
jgi:hypothetical protein